ncbi:hypothetical protein A2962_04735 [Candidatus Woesebacteria bacterium RIFCSPLOWO2_01_FULL_39_61]|uniref:Type 4 fimbrial biogenesis protein PilX N-terminal domain-containing protein n=1 Tax=Candidatus Woesebacteria bacterium RIFCSPHIGHO2_02_FULL_39_13 TaxID=1802505 RepID=A0A1F7Z3Q8_9BACT|nr:MAG: hypothetical protein A2692_01055 [Candidatus Woesebacteria bacterium RIFCSPHIGHO2_01_FULL_39_95]OGM34306.1 MAG: hypothetical protein A3D01_00860 [Candidatus Woesebacteria bacterium RIFCSPHIGHO2_02_FULL_39_13]OGM39088.1 MAG: hypothetical protein A3E13_01585 [Candidatus Woesebacteria bacterium RIFCSPHIGHO2_12_FULL_40_20]OGM68643.1 MAG: hypothetical protein A2962_04735 [Candidatus Woesebacteria bacterium RIFCSPLOWO2_01_FULL_39_61]OGM73499.1 MAG: hypothetical protein A3H19_00330 [Candidatus
MYILPKVLKENYSKKKAGISKGHWSRIYLYSSSNTKGQALLIVLLTMAVILTVVLSVTSRSVVELTTTTYQEDARRAFSAAEAGVEQVLLTQTNVTQVLDPSANVGFDAELTYPQLGSTYNYPNLLSSGEVATFWLVSHDNTTNALTCSAGNCTRANRLQVCFGNNLAAQPAIEVEIYFDTSQQSFASPNNFSNIKAVRTTYDPSASRRVLNNFGSTSASPCPFGGGYSFYSGLINLTALIPAPPNCSVNNANCLVMAKVRILYNPNPQPVGIGVLGAIPNLPAQGFRVESTGTAGESVRSLHVVRSYPEPQSAFNSAVFSKNNLTKP